VKRFLAIVFAVLIGAIITAGTFIEMQLTVVKSHQLDQK
jgi:hypothetical protein